MASKWQRQYSAEEMAFFAEYRSNRKHLRPVECNDGPACWVRDGPPSYLSGSDYGGRCAGCNGSPRPRHAAS